MAKKSSPEGQQAELDRRQALLEGQPDGAPEPPEASPEPPAASEEQEDVIADDTVDASPDPPQEIDEPPSISSVLEQARQLGYQGEDETEAASVMYESYQRAMQERQQLEQRSRELEELAHYGSEYLRTQREQQEAAARQQQEPKGPDPWWNPPGFDPRWIEQYRDVQMSPDGQPTLGWKANTPREVRETAEQYQQYLEQWATDLVQRPHEVLPKVIEQEFDRLFEARIAAREETTRLSSFAERVRDSNRDWMYAQDSQGREVLTEQGQVMTNILGEVASSGVTDPELQWQYAVALYDYHNRSRQEAATQQTTQAQQTAAQKRRQQLERGAGKTMHNRTGTVPRPDEEPQHAQNPHLTPGQQLLQQLRQDGAEFV